MVEYYILEDRRVVPVEGVLEWGAWMEQADRIVARGEIGEVTVSTVFLGLDHAFGGPVPLLFETLVFGGPLDGDQDRYPTWDEAVAGHKAMVERVKGGDATIDVTPKSIKLGPRPVR